jgi:RimJ/RimL family protein N-acetyltransferase
VSPIRRTLGPASAKRVAWASVRECPSRSAYRPNMKVSPPAPPLSDGMVTLRPWTPGDVPEVTLACRDPEIVRWTTQIPEDYTEQHARSWIESTSAGWAKGNAEFAITETQTNVLAGAIGLFARESWVAEIGYWMAAPFRNRGLATRALALVSDWGHSLGFVRLQLMMLPGNEASARIAAKAGFNEEGLLRAYAKQRGAIRDVVMWSRVKQ